MIDCGHSGHGHQSRSGRSISRSSIGSSRNDVATPSPGGREQHPLQCLPGPEPVGSSRAVESTASCGRCSKLADGRPTAARRSRGRGLVPAPVRAGCQALDGTPSSPDVPITPRARPGAQSLPPASGPPPPPARAPRPRRPPTACAARRTRSHCPCSSPICTASGSWCPETGPGVPRHDHVVHLALPRRGRPSVGELPTTPERQLAVRVGQRPDQRLGAQHPDRQPEVEQRRAAARCRARPRGRRPRASGPGRRAPR